MSWLSFTYSAGRPNIVFNIDYSKKRISNATMRYTFTVKWNLKYSDSYLYSGYFLKIKATCENSSSGWQIMRNYSDSTTGTTVHTLTFSLDVPSTTGGTSQTITFTGLNDSSYDSNYMNFSRSGTVITDALLWTNCSSASNILIPSVFTPKDGLEVTWTKGSGGTNNPIIGYDVYLWGSASGTYPSTSRYDYKISTTSTSVTFSSPEYQSFFDKYRGYFFYIGIVTKSQYNTTSMAYSNRAVLNVLPPAPTSPVREITISSKSTGATLTITPGTKTPNQGYTTTSVYYSTSANSNYQKFTSNSTLLPSGTTYYFKTYDGKEYSKNYIEVQILKNIAPTVALSFNSSNSTKTIVYKNGVLQDNYYESLNFSFTTNKSSGTIKLYQKGENSDNLVISYSIASTSTQKNLNLRNCGFLSNVSLEFYAIFNDGIEDSSESIHTTNIIMISAPPSFLTTYNQFALSDIVGTTKGHFYDKVRFVYDYDSYYYNGTFTSNLSNNFINITKDKSEKQMWWDVTFSTASFSNGETVSFSNVLSQEESITSLGNLIRAQEIKFVNDTLKRTIKPFSSENSFSLSPFYLSTEKTLEAFYAEKDLNRNGADIKLVFNSIIYNEIKESVEWEEGNNDSVAVKFNFSGKGFYEKIKNLIPPSRSGKISCSLQVIITNLFGQNFSNSYPLILDYDEPINVSNFSISKGIYGSNSFNFSNGDRICEGIKLNFEPLISIYNGNSFDYMIQIKRGSGNFTDYLNDWQTIETQNLVVGHKSPMSIKLSITTPTVQEISSEENCVFRLLIRVMNQTFIFDSQSYERIKYIPSEISFIKGEYSKGTGYSLVYKITEGYEALSSPLPEVKKVYAIGVEKEKIELPSEAWEKTNIVYSGSPMEEHETFKEVSLQTETTLTVTFGTVKVQLTKSATSNSILIYSLAPTISYRQNNLGLNTFPNKTDSVLEISPYKTRDKIYLIPPTENIPTVAFDLTKGTFLNLIIDCGEITI